MKILAVEFSSEQRSVAIAEKTSGSPFHLLGTASEKGGRSTHAIALVELALQTAKIEREQIGVIAVGIGPGSYTGIRAAIALAQGWQLARETKLLGISSIECLARQAFANGIRGRANFVVDAQRNEFYLTTYDIGDVGIREAEPLRLATFAEVERRISERQPVFGPSVSDAISGAQNCFPEAATLAHLAGERTDFVSGENLEPIYLREVSFVKAPAPRMI